jgi:hypothetical protein
MGLADRERNRYVAQVRAPSVAGRAVRREAGTAR